MAETGKTLMRNSIYLFFSGIMTNATMGIYYPVLARFLTIEEMGEMVSLSLTLTFFSILFPFSLQQASIYFSSMYLGQNDEKRAWGSWKGFRNIGIFLSIVAGSCGYFLVSTMLALMGITNPLYALILTINVAILVLRAFIATAIYPKERFDVPFYFNAADLALRLPTTLLLVDCGWGLFGVLFGWIAGDVFRLSLYSIWTHRNIPKFKAQYLHRESVEYAAPLWGAAILTYFADNVERFILVIALGTGELAIYTAALIVYNVLYLGLTAMSVSIFPKLTVLNQQEDKTQSTLLTSKAIKFTLLVFLPALLGVAYFSSDLLLLFLGPDYVGANISLIILMLGLSVSLPYMIQQSLLMAMKKTARMSLARAAGLFVNLAITMILIVEFGNYASAIGRVLGLIVVFIVQSLLIGNVKMQLASQGNLRIIASSLTALGLTAATNMAFSIIGVSSLLLRLSLMPFMLLVYLSLIRLTRALDHRDKEFVLSFVPSYLGNRIRQMVALLLGYDFKHEDETIGQDPPKQTKL